MPSNNPRIAILGLHLESNRFAPPVGKAEFEATLVLNGEAMLADARSEHPRQPGGGTGFIRDMDAHGAWQPQPIKLADAGAAGCITRDYLDELEREMRAGLEAALPLDGVYFAQHGAAVCTDGSDPDGRLFAMAREVVGAKVPIVSVLDLHANVSQRMVESTDVLVAYRTNPHVDQYARGVECAGVMRELLAGLQPTVAFLRLPLVAPQVTQLTAVGPYADAIARGQACLDERVLNVSILGGFTYGDTPENGMAFIVTTRGDRRLAERLCAELASATWAERERFVPHLTSLEDCIAQAVARGEQPALPALLIADVADNPGGGGRGNTTWLLKGLHEAGAKKVLLGVFNDAALAAEAHARGLGARFEACFNTQEGDRRSLVYRAEVSVRHLSHGRIIGRAPGSRANMAIDLGATAVLDLGELQVVVISRRQQCIDPGYFENFGLDVRSARTVVVKSRGHFRAGFSVYFEPEQIIECDAPGLTSPNLANFDWQGFRRPIFPLDTEVSWQPEF